MTQKIEKSSDGTQNNSNNAESNNVYRLIEKTAEQLTASATRYDERAENGQKITFAKAEQKKAVGTAANADKDGFLQGIFWTGYVTTADGQRHDFERLDSNGISRKFTGICSWKRATRVTLLDGNATRTAEQRTDDATTAIAHAKGKPTAGSVTAMLWTLADEEGLLSKLHARVMQMMTTADAEAVEKASAKESKTAKRERELQEAKAAAEAATTATESAIKLLLATGQYKTEEEVRKALGL